MTVKELYYVTDYPATTRPYGLNYKMDLRYMTNAANSGHIEVTPFNYNDGPDIRRRDVLKRFFFKAGVQEQVIIYYRKTHASLLHLVIFTFQYEKLRFDSECSL